MFKIEGKSCLFESFLNEWHSDSPFVEARTSGSTGTPKTIKLSKGDMLASASATVEFFKIDESSTLFCPLSASYIAGKMMAVRAIIAQCTLNVAEPSNNLLPALDPLKRIPIDLMCIVPSQVPSLIECVNDGIEVKNVIIGGAPVSPAMERELLKAGISGYVTYGMTETCSHVALRRIGEESYKPLDDIRFEVELDGRLVIYSQKRSFGRLVTNDVVDLTQEGSFRWKGRADNVINSGGIKIHPEEIEGALKEYIGIETAVIPFPDEKWGQVAILVLEEDFRIKEDAEILRFLKKHCGDYGPKKILRVKKFPATPTGKLARMRLIEMLLKRQIEESDTPHLG